MKASEANETKWVHCSVNLSIYASFIFDACERVVKGRMDGKNDSESLAKLAGAFTVRDHWRDQALMLEGALPGLEGSPRELAESALENYRLSTGVLQETISLSAAELKSSGFVH